MDLTNEEIDEMNKKTFEESEQEYSAFLEEFKKGKCIYCNENLNDFDPNKICFHWLLFPRRIKKENFNILLKNFGCFNLMAYLRWVANQEEPFKNINDLKSESRESRVIETTIKYKDKEWTFCCNKSDLEGHGRFNFPHYHFNMSINGKRFINFCDFHIKFSEEDLLKIDSILGKNKKIKHHWLRGAGMQDIMDLPPNELIDSLRYTNEESKSSLHLSNWIEAKPGKKIRGEDIERLFEEQKETGRTFASLAREKLKDTYVQTIISPSEEVPKIRQRSSRKKKENTAFLK